jgi:hypothetical protein
VGRIAGGIAQSVAVTDFDGLALKHAAPSLEARHSGSRFTRHFTRQ